MMLSFRVETSRVISTAKTLTLTVLMDLPHTVDASVNLFLGGVARDVEGSDKPEDNVLRLHLEKRGSECHTSDLVESEGASSACVAGEVS